MEAVADQARLSGPRLRVLPILLVLVLGIAVIFGAFAAADFIQYSMGARWPDWLRLIVAEAFELILALVGIAIAGKLLPNADFGLRWPPGRTYLGLALFWGVAFALIMLVADHWPALIALKSPGVPEEPTTKNIVGWLTFELLWVGICEETLFRGFLLGLLTALSPSKLRVLGTEISTAGITLAILFALAHASNFATRPFYEAFAQQIYAIALGIIYAWLREHSKSLVPAIVAHSLSDFGETGLEFMLNALL
ncbi:MAG TPA: CPBP family intramembrane glutamic endopeptidase [Sphingomicrobium sp.]|jgi:membrane protease YdiL (CAAX protease family)|nr:CPBP family intramembrane glutamic endopeptidase [Sphingomicrobium sp.]